ncbi:hypothetical protein [Clostridium sp. B9]|uniref:hypothetical protein n=1 Tax=Clostridium sp. B9 TaxID=3423224 RepID=UPI003D2F109D
MIVPIYVKYNSDEEELIDLKRDIISDILAIDDMNVLGNLVKLTSHIRFKTT